MNHLILKLELEEAILVRHALKLLLQESREESRPEIQTLLDVVGQFISLQLRFNKKVHGGLSHASAKGNLKTN